MTRLCTLVGAMKDALRRVTDSLPSGEPFPRPLDAHHIAELFGHIDVWMDEAIERMADIALAQHNAGVSQALGDDEKATVRT